jgi:hypothetical protein
MAACHPGPSEPWVLSPQPACVFCPATLHCRVLLRPYSTDGDLMGDPADPWASAARQLAPEGWGPRKQALMARVFLEFFADALSGYEKFVGRPPGGSMAAGAGDGKGGLSGGSHSQRASRHCGATSSSGGGGGGPPPAVSQSGSSVSLGCLSSSSSFSRLTGLSGGPSNLNINMAGLMAHHDARTS